MSKILLAALLLLSTFTYAQDVTADWYILERGCTVGVIKAGANDLTQYLAATNFKPLDKAGLDAIDKSLSFAPGYIVLIHTKYNGYYLAQDMEGRGLVVKGNITKVEHGAGSTVGYLKEDIKTPSGSVLKKTSFVWVSEHKPGDANATIQYANKQYVQVPMSKLWNINETTLDMAKELTLKTVQ